MVDIDILARVLTAAILLWAAGAKVLARNPDRLEPYGIPRVLRAPGYYFLIAFEVAVAGALLAGVSFGAFAAVALGGLFVGALVHARARGARRLDCGCFGSKEQSVETLIVRAVGFTAVAGIGAASVEASMPSRETLVVLALAVLSVAVLVLAGLVLALYRQVGVLTLRVGPGVALELAEEGPVLGKGAPELHALTGTGPELAVFFSPGCRLCRQLAPAVRALARDGLPVHVLYEDEEPVTFERWSVPGTPFAVHVVDGTVVAKGTVNTLEQLEQLLALGAQRVEYAAA
jgi:Methylamine utilisation protein MauE/Thioredoxin domain